MEKDQLETFNDFVDWLSDVKSAQEALASDKSQDLTDAELVGDSMEIEDSSVLLESTGTEGDEVNASQTRMLPSWNELCVCPAVDGESLGINPNDEDTELAAGDSVLIGDSAFFLEQTDRDEVNPSQNRVLLWNELCAHPTADGESLGFNQNDEDTEKLAVGDSMEMDDSSVLQEATGKAVDEPIPSLSIMKAWNELCAGPGGDGEAPALEVNPNKKGSKNVDENHKAPSVHSHVSSVATLLLITPYWEDLPTVGENYSEMEVSVNSTEMEQRPDSDNEERSPLLPEGDENTDASSNEKVVAWLERYEVHVATSSDNQLEISETENEVNEPGSFKQRPRRNTKKCNYKPALSSTCSSSSVTKITKKPKPKRKKERCGICNVERLNLAHHMQHMHSTTKEERAQLNEKMKKKCSLCEKRVRHLRRHMLQAHGSPEEKDALKKQCSICKQKFLHLRRHMIEAHGSPEEKDALKKQCHICKKKFRDLRRHMTQAHGSPEEKDALKKQCSICKKKFHNIQLHMTQAHGSPEEKDVLKKQCSICKKTFRHLQRHMIQAHGSPEEKDGLKKQCSICKQKFRNLNIHIARRHSPKRQMTECEFCKKKVYELSRHKLRQHTPRENDN